VRRDFRESGAETPQGQRGASGGGGRPVWLQFELRRPGRGGEVEEGLKAGGPGRGIGAGATAGDGCSHKRPRSSGVVGR